jgi:hypothetical protein
LSEHFNAFSQFILCDGSVTILVYDLEDLPNLGLFFLGNELLCQVLKDGGMKFPAGCEML